MKILMILTMSLLSLSAFSQTALQFKASDISFDMAPFKIVNGVVQDCNLSVRYNKPGSFLENARSYFSCTYEDYNKLRVQLAKFDSFKNMNPEGIIEIYVDDAAKPFVPEDIDQIFKLDDNSNFQKLEELRDENKKLKSELDSVKVSKGQELKSCQEVLRKSAYSINDLRREVTPEALRLSDEVKPIMTNIEK